MYTHDCVISGLDCACTNSTSYNLKWLCLCMWCHFFSSVWGVLLEELSVACGPFSFLNNAGMLMEIISFTLSPLSKMLLKLHCHTDFWHVCDQKYCPQNWLANNYILHHLIHMRTCAHTHTHTHTHSLQIWHFLHWHLTLPTLASLG